LLLAAGTLCGEALAAAEELAASGIEAAVIDPIYIKPLDKELILTWAAKCGRVVTIEENVLAGGFGSGVLELLAESGLALPVKTIGLPDRFIEHGPQATLKAICGLDAAGLARGVKDWMSGLTTRFRQIKIG
jgi:1-deoxy-D-xylulose-5-phosphate synthase